MASTAITCPAGSIVTFSTTLAGTYAAVSATLEINKITLPSVKLGKVDVTNFNTSVYPFAEEKADFGEPGDCELECNLTAADFILLKGNTMYGVQQFFKVSITAGGPVATTPVFVLVGTLPGYISNVSGDVAVKGKSSMKVTIHCTGQDTWAA